MNYNEILKYFPIRVGQVISKELDNNENLEEIRLRSNKPIILKFTNKEKILKGFIETEDILQTLQSICDNSIYSYQNQICEGFITIKGGHRVGITGSAIISNGKITNINYISNLNFRIARQMIGCSNNLLDYILDLTNNTIYNTLIISSPGAGKTTVLRDVIRRISNGIEDIGFKGKNISVVDERGEIAAMYKGVPQNDIGIRTDILDNIKKSDGMKMVIRSMSPDIIVADEIGSIEDVEAINYAICCGIKGIFTAHGSSFEDLNLNPAISGLIKKQIFERLVFLDKKHKGNIEKIYTLNKINQQYEIYSKNK